MPGLFYVLVCFAAAYYCYDVIDVIIVMISLCVLLIVVVDVFVIIVVHCLLLLIVAYCFCRTSCLAASGCWMLLGPCEEFTRLAETRLAQNSLTHIKIV